MRGYLTTSHFYGRRKESVRFDEDNCDIFCRRDHDYFERNKDEYRKWKKEKLGKKKFDSLTIRANYARVKSRDDVVTELIIKEKMRLLRKERDGN